MTPIVRTMFVLCCGLMVLVSTVFTAPLIPKDIVASSSPGHLLDINQAELMQVMFGKDGLVTSLIKHGAQMLMPQQQPVLNDQPLSTIFSQNNDPRTRPQSESQFKLDTPFDISALITSVVSLIQGSQSGPAHLDALMSQSDRGLCEGSTCAQIYDQLEAFRHSNMFTNLRTFMTLMQDKDGLKLIAELLANPSMLQDVFPMRTVEAESQVVHDLVEHEQIKKADVKLGNILPEIAFSLDEQTGDYDYGYEYNVKSIDQSIPVRDQSIPVRDQSISTDQSIPIDSLQFDSELPQKNEELIENVDDSKSRQPFLVPQISEILHDETAGSIIDEIFSKSLDGIDEEVTEKTSTDYETLELVKIVRRKEADTHSQPMTTHDGPTAEKYDRKDDEYYALYYDDDDQ